MLRSNIPHLVALIPLLAPLARAAQDDPPPVDEQLDEPVVVEGLTLETVTTKLSNGSELALERGVLEVPVVRSAQDGGQILLEFHRFQGPDTPLATPPIFILRGGPSFRGLSSELKRKGFYDDNVKMLADIADVVVVGQRGIGSSTPDTLCSGPVREKSDVAVSYEERALALSDACRACRQRWEAEGLDLSGLNVIEAAADVIDVADALGYARITLVGGSYGSHWGMAIMRNHPDRVARAVLNGIEGPDHTYDMPGHVLNALRRIAESAEASAELAELIPEGGLIQAFEDVLGRLEKRPRLIEVGRAKVLLDARRLRDLALGVSARASSRKGIKSWPADILRLARDDFDDAARATVRNNFFPRLPNASFFMLDCGSGISAERHAQLLADPAAAIVGPLGWFYDSTCPVWEADLGEDFRHGFETEVPTLLVHGTWDTSTPFENALELEPSFKNGKLVVVEGGSHGAMGEALVESPVFRTAVERFLRMGDMESVPALIELPTPAWVVPDK